MDTRAKWSYTSTPTASSANAIGRTSGRQPCSWIRTFWRLGTQAAQPTSSVAAGHSESSTVPSTYTPFDAW